MFSSFCSLFKLSSSRGNSINLCSFVLYVLYRLFAHRKQRIESTQKIQHLPFLLTLVARFVILHSFFLGLCIKIELFKFILFKTSRKTYQLVVSVYFFPIESYRSYRVFVFVFHLFSINLSS